MDSRPESSGVYVSQDAPHENEDYLTKQIITYIGNKRALLPFIGRGLEKVRRRLGRDRLAVFDVFSGSGIVARFFKRFAHTLLVNDLETYTVLINRCYLSNRDDRSIPVLEGLYRDLRGALTEESLRPGLITGLYAPRNDDKIGPGERVFYTHRNAMYIDTARRLIGEIEEQYRPFFLAPLLSEASIHSNTSGVFKGFYKNRETGIGQFGGRNRDALARIRGEIHLPFPVFSNFDCDCVIYNGDSNLVIRSAPEVDLAYLDPPYNQHPFGSNYFMLNLIAEYERPSAISPVSGIPPGWNRSLYNKKRSALGAMRELAAGIKAKFVLVSFNSEGLISFDEMGEMLRGIGTVDVLETVYPAFRGSRNLSGRGMYVKEYLYVLEK
jgi:adenine-specific DNA-methyltransferase